VNSKKINLSPEEFYQEVSTNYDLMTRFQQRQEGEKEVLQSWLTRYPFVSALDAACGTGLHAILLSKMGLQITGADISAEMLHKARINSRVAGVKIKWIKSRMENLSHSIQQTFGAVLCLGNSIPHLLSSSRFHSALRNFYQLLDPGGWVIMQLLNYHKVLSEKQRIIGIHRNGDLEFIRFYDFVGQKINFNILTIEWKGNQGFSNLKSTLLYPYTRKEIQTALRKSGLKIAAIYGDMQFRKFQERHSMNLVIVAQK
jgi:ubiquinone/menaquinone biosynthesis C-methylase UbiE